MADDKFVPSQQNVWSSNYINDFRQMIDSNHGSMNNFHRVASMLETSGQIYGIKVDSLHSDVLRLSSGIRRQSIADESLDDIISDMSNVRHVRRPRPTVVGNAQLINAVLQTTEEPSRPLENHTSVSAKNLLQNVLASDKYAISLQTQGKFWVEGDASAVNEIEDESTIFNCASVNLRTSNWIPSSSDVLRPRLNGYTISNTPFDQFRCPETATNASQINLEDIETSDDQSLDLQFDINAPVSVEEPAVMMPEAIAASFVDEGDRNALRRCSAFQLSAVVLDDLRPVSCSPLQYSYRRLTNDSLTAEPSHWKLPSIIQQNSLEGKNKKRRRRRKKAMKDEPVKFKKVLSESVEQKFMPVDDERVNRIRNVDMSKWNSNRLKAPSRMSYASAKLFAPLLMHSLENDDPDDGESNVQSNMHVTAAGAETEVNGSIRVNDTPNMDIDVVVVEMEGDGLVTVNNSVDSQFLPCEMEMEGDGLVPVNNSVGNHFLPCEMDLDSDEAEATPSDDVQQPQIPPFQLDQFMQVSPANINVKEITSRCLKIICDLEEFGGDVTFAQIYHQLQGGDMVITPAVAFSSILELANKNNFSLIKIGENNFVIKRS